MIAPDAVARTRDDLPEPASEQAPFSLVPGMAEDFAVAGAAFVATCNGVAALRLTGSAPAGPVAGRRNGRFPP